MSMESLNGLEFIGAHLKVIDNSIELNQFRVLGFREKGDGHLYYKV